MDQWNLDIELHGLFSNYTLAGYDVHPSVVRKPSNIHIPAVSLYGNPLQL